MTTTLQIRNTVRDFDEWKAAFDKFERFRADHGVRSYRVARRADDDHDVEISLDFDTAQAATDFRDHLEQIWSTPQSQAQLVDHDEPVLFEIVAQHTYVSVV